MNSETKDNLDVAVRRRLEEMSTDRVFQGILVALPDGALTAKAMLLEIRQRYANAVEAHDNIVSAYAELRESSDAITSEPGPIDGSALVIALQQDAMTTVTREADKRVADWQARCREIEAAYRELLVGK